MGTEKSTYKGTESRRLSLYRLLTGLLSGFLMFGMVLGSGWLAQMDPTLVVVRPTYHITLPTPTLYPTHTATTPTTSPEPALSPTPTETALPGECPLPAGWIAYQVREGDTLFALAWAARTNVYALMQANCLTSMEIVAGIILYLPPTVYATVTPIPCGPPPHWQIAYVNAGDTLYSLSVRYGTTVVAIRQANCIRGDTVYAGQPLYLPPVIVVPPTPTWTPTPTPTWTPTATPTWTPTPETSLTFTPTPTLTPSPSSSPSPTPSLTATVPVSPTFTPTITPTPEMPFTVTLTLTPTPTPTPTETETPTPTITPSPTATPDDTVVFPDTPTPTATPNE